MAKTQWILREIFQTGNTEQRQERFQRLFGEYITDTLFHRGAESSDE